jgi:Coenzyme PQQ synthesis protein D (PqqD)
MVSSSTDQRTDSLTPPLLPARLPQGYEQELFVLSLTSRIHIPDSILSHQFEDEIVLLNLTTGVYFGLDKVGTRIWQVIQQHQPLILQTVCDTVLPEYDVAEDRFADDLLSLVVRLQEHRLLEVA